MPSPESAPFRNWQRQFRIKGGPRIDVPVVACFRRETLQCALVATICIRPTPTPFLSYKSRLAARDLDVGLIWIVEGNSGSLQSGWNARKQPEADIDGLSLRMQNTRTS